MDYASYKKKYFVSPAPPQREGLQAMQGLSLYVQPYADAIAFYSGLFGAPQYIEGDSVHGWQLGEAWFTLFPSKAGNPRNVDIGLFMDSREKVDELFAEFVSAGAKGEAPIDTLMYEPVYVAFLRDPFSLDWSIIYRLAQK